MIQAALGVLEVLRPLVHPEAPEDPVVQNKLKLNKIPKRYDCINIIIWKCARESEERRHKGIILNEPTDDPGSPLRPGTTSMLPITYPGSPCKTDQIS